MEYKELPYNSPNGRVYDIMFSDKASIINLCRKKKTELTERYSITLHLET